MGVKEEEEERPVRVQGGNQHKPGGEEVVAVGRWLAAGEGGERPLPSHLSQWLSSHPQPCPPTGAQWSEEGSLPLPALPPQGSR